MSSTPWKVYDPNHTIVGQTRHAEDAAALVALYGDGARIYYAEFNKKWLVFEQGKDGCAGESYDAVADICRAVQKQKYVARYGIPN